MSCRAAIPAHQTSKARTQGAITGQGSLFRLFIGSEQISSYADTFASARDPRLKSVVIRMRENGVLLSPIGLGALSTAMTETDISHLGEIFEAVLRSLKR